MVIASSCEEWPLLMYQVSSDDGKGDYQSFGRI